MKLLLAACLAVLTGCVSTSKPCHERANELAQEQAALGRVPVAMFKLPPATVVMLLRDPVTERQFGILVSFPGSLVPAPDSPFRFEETCTAEGGTGRIYVAEFSGGPTL